MSDIREANGHPLRVIRAQHNLTLAELSQAINVSVATLSRIENGLQHAGPDTRKRLAKYFNKTSQDLGLLAPGKKEAPLEPEKPEPKPRPKEGPTIVISRTHPIDALTGAGEQTPEQQLGSWLALEAAQIGQLFDAGWTTEGILDSLRVVLQGVQSMPKVNRRKLLELGGAAMMTSVALPIISQVAEQDRQRLYNGLNQGIAESWKYFHRIENEQVFVIGQAQLRLLQLNHFVLQPFVRPLLYASLQMLLGSCLQFQNRYDEGLQLHTSAYIAALEAGDIWLTVQSLLCQINSLQGLKKHKEALQTITSTLRILEPQANEASVRAKAHLITCWADSLMALGENDRAKEKLNEAEEYVDQIHPNEEFDRTSWLQFSGKYALLTGDCTASIRYYNEALSHLSPDWLLRQIFILIPMMVAYGCQRDKNMSLITAKKAVEALCKLKSVTMNEQFVTSIQHGLSSTFLNDKEVQTFVADAKQQIFLSTSARTNVLVM